jgi:Flp pilus assembly protein TadB
MGDLGPVGVWVFLSIGAVALFGVFLPVVTWIDSQRKEREAFYQAETFRRLAESSGDGAKAAIELMRDQTRQERLKKREGMKVGGLVNIGVGAGLCIFLRVLTGPGGPWLVGLLPGFIGVALLAYVLFFAEPL